MKCDEQKTLWFFRMKKHFDGDPIGEPTYESRYERDEIDKHERTKINGFHTECAEN